MKKEPIKARETPAEIRVGNFEEVVKGYSEEESLLEATRCLQCKNPVCISGCPVGIDIKKFIYQITQKNYQAAYFTIREKNNFPSICGRVCPAEYQCRKTCILTKKGSPFASEQAINIHFLERFAGDYGKNKNLDVREEKEEKFSKFKVAVVGSGPAGLCCAGELARKGVHVDIFESLHKTGGVLRYGIPPFRLPWDVLDFEINYLKKLGVNFITNFLVGKVKTIKELFNQGYTNLFLGLGAGVPSFLGIKGENLCNIYSVNEFLTRVNLMSAYKFPEFHTPVNIGKNVLIVGGGNTAIDSARVALRLQKLNGLPLNTTIIYRRTEIEMPARRLEIEHAREEGVKFEFLVQPKEFIGDNQGMVRRLICLKSELGEPDSSGRRRPIIIEGSEFQLDCDLCVIAVGLKANQILINATPELKTDKYSDIIVDSESMESSIKGVFAGGDIVGGEGTVIEAMGMAKKASSAIINELSKKGER
ncbi:MAG: NADPH-dependent glutamate synthase [Candidatus Omnitrophica bacterium]|nr:NADPH-dependent glutamate synthase [Candidatus Omnitrophota bacterium]